MKRFYKAWEIAGEPELHNLVWKIGNHTYECAGYSRTGNTVRFFDVIPTDDNKLLPVWRYLNPDSLVELSNE